MKGQHEQLTDTQIMDFLKDSMGLSTLILGTAEPNTLEVVADFGFICLKTLKIKLMAMEIYDSDNPKSVIFPHLEELHTEIMIPDAIKANRILFDAPNLKKKMFIECKRGFYKPLMDFFNSYNLTDLSLTGELTSDGIYFLLGNVRKVKTLILHSSITVTVSFIKNGLLGYNSKGNRLELLMFHYFDQNLNAAMDVEIPKIDRELYDRGIDHMYERIESDTDENILELKVKKRH